MRLGLILLAIAAVWLPAAVLRAAPPPNIVLIIADDLGFGSLGCYGQQKIKTPHIDQLAAQGLRFTHCYAGSNVCAPSRSTLMTGLHTGHTPIRANGAGMYLSADDVTIAEALKSRGFATGMFGKWGLGDAGTPGHPNRQGFDEFFGQTAQVHAHFYYPYYLWKNSEQFYLPENEGRKRVRYAHDVIHQQALEFIRRHQSETFFCYLPYTLPHVELVVPEDSLAPYLGMFDEQPIADPRPGYIGADKPYATFAGMISRLDRHVGEVLALLDELQLRERTIVIFTSDNGAQAGAWQQVTDFFAANGELRDYKGSFYEGGIRVPLIARWPGVIPAGQTSDHVCAFWDFLPTLAELTGASSALPERFDGISFANELTGNPSAQQHEFLYWEYPEGTGFSQAVRWQQWKAVRPRAEAAWELYDLAGDPREQQNVAADHPQVLERIQEIAVAEHKPPRVFGNAERGGVADFVR